MSYPISSDKFGNPLLKELLVILTEYFQSIDGEFYVIGAAARDIILSGIHDQIPGRKTEDLDIAIAIPNWDAFEEISLGLCNLKDFKKSDKQKQRFFYKDVYMLDIVPFGEIAKADKNIYWPPEETHAMSVVGFTEVAKSTLSLKIDDEFTVQVASLPGIFILKIAAWRDRKARTNKDADDMAFIIKEYLEVNLERAVAEHSDIYDAEEFKTFTAGAILIGRDIKEVLRGDQEMITEFSAIIDDEVAKEEGSVLINQILETHTTLKYEDVYEALQSITTQLKK
jgi:predicted nucleotidyltransferase